MKTWSLENALGAGTQTSKSLIGVDGDRIKSTRWQAEALTTFELPWDLRLVSVVRSQSGTHYARTFTTRLNYGNATIRAEDANIHRTETITIFDFRSAKAATPSTAHRKSTGVGTKSSAPMTRPQAK